MQRSRDQNCAPMEVSDFSKVSDFYLRKLFELNKQTDKKGKTAVVQGVQNFAPGEGS